MRPVMPITSARPALFTSREMIFGRAGQVGEQAGEFAGGLGVLPLFFDDEASEGGADLHEGPCIN